MLVSYIKKESPNLAGNEISVEECQLSRFVVFIHNLQENSQVSRMALKVWASEQTQLQRCFVDNLCLFCMFQIWRPVTATFFFPTGFQYLINLYFLFHYSTRLETGEKTGLVTHEKKWQCLIVLNSNMVWLFRQVWWQTCRLCLHAPLQLDLHCRIL